MPWKPSEDSNGRTPAISQQANPGFKTMHSAEDGDKMEESQEQPTKNHEPAAKFQAQPQHIQSNPRTSVPAVQSNIQPLTVTRKTHQGSTTSSHFTNNQPYNMPPGEHEPFTPAMRALLAEVNRRLEQESTQPVTNESLVETSLANRTDPRRAFSAFVPNFPDDSSRLEEQSWQRESLMASLENDKKEEVEVKEDEETKRSLSSIGRLSLKSRMITSVNDWSIYE